MSLSLKDLNAADDATFVHLAEPLVENSAWVLRRIAGQRPFASRVGLCDAIEGAIRSAAVQERIALFRAHPELAGAEAQRGTMTPASSGEQGRLGLMSLGPTDHARLRELNAAYRARFGFPFIIALRRHADLKSVLDAFERRLGNGPEKEMETTVAEIMHVVRGRAARLFSGAQVAPAQET